MMENFNISNTPLSSLRSSVGIPSKKESNANGWVFHSECTYPNISTHDVYKVHSMSQYEVECALNWIRSNPKHIMSNRWCGLKLRDWEIIFLERLRILRTKTKKKKQYGAF